MTTHTESTNGPARSRYEVQREISCGWAVMYSTHDLMDAQAQLGRWSQRWNPQRVGSRIFDTSLNMEVV